MQTSKTLILFLLIATSCSTPAPNPKIQDIIAGVDKVLIRNNCYARYLNADEIAFLKDTIGQGSYMILNGNKIQPRYSIMLYQDDSIIGYASVDSLQGNRLAFTSSEYQAEVEIEFNLGNYLETLTNSSGIDCSNAFRRVLLDTLTVREFIDLLPVKNPVPNVNYFMSVFGEVDSTWMTKDDIAYMITLIDRTDTAYCTGSPLSSYAPANDGDYSSLGGQIINLIDSYRLKKTFPVFTPGCFKNDSIKRNEILNWWNQTNKSTDNHSK